MRSVTAHSMSSARVHDARSPALPMLGVVAHRMGDAAASPADSTSCDLRLARLVATARWRVTDRERSCRRARHLPSGVFLNNPHPPALSLILAPIARCPSMSPTRYLTLGVIGSRGAFCCPLPLPTTPALVPVRDVAPFDDRARGGSTPPSCFSRSPRRSWRRRRERPALCLVARGRMLPLFALYRACVGSDAPVPDRRAAVALARSSWSRASSSLPRSLARRGGAASGELGPARSLARRIGGDDAARACSLTDGFPLAAAFVRSRAPTPLRCPARDAAIVPLYCCTTPFSSIRRSLRAPHDPSPLVLILPYVRVLVH